MGEYTPTIQPQEEVSLSIIITMPFKSEAQRRWMWKNDPEMAQKWEAETPKGKLPKRLHRKVRTKMNRRRNN